MQKQRPITLFLFSTLFLISGAAGLIYEIIWERVLQLFFGSTMTSVTLIVGAYMAGLGLGSLLGGRVANKSKHTLLIYGLLETGIAIFGAFSLPLIIQTGQTTAGSPYGLVFLISFSILLIPTTLMGMTLPFLTQSFVHRVETSGQIIGILYGINTFGAALGAVFAGYFLIGRFGLDGATYIAVALNAIVGLFSIALTFWKWSERGSTSQNTTHPTQWGYKTILLSSFLVGFIGLGYQMLWIRILHIVNKNTAYSFPSILFIFLLGLAIGGYIFGRKADFSDNPILLFCKIELSAATLAAISLYVFWVSLQFNPSWIQDFFESQKPALPFVKVHHELLLSKKLLLLNLWEYALPILILVLPASIVLGGGLPVLDRIAINHPSLAGRRVGDIHLANIIGSLSGTLTISFVLLPAIGSEWTLKLLAILALLFPALYFRVHSHQSIPRWDLVQLASVGCILIIGLFLTPGKGNFYQQLYSYGIGQEAVISESSDSVLALTYLHGSDQKTGLFWIGGEVNSFFPPKSIYENRALACAGASEPKRVLVIGFGGGYTTLFFKSIPQVNEIVVVELIHDIAPFLSENLASARVTLSDPRVAYYVDDGRRFLNASPEEKYDLIAIDPFREHTTGHNTLYSEEAMQIYLDHLTPGGVLCAWMEEERIVPHTIARVFPFVNQFLNGLVIGSNTPISYNQTYMEEIAGSYRTLADQIFAGGLPAYPSTDNALSGLIADRDQILQLEQNSPYLTDLRPVLEYYLLTKPTK